MNINEIKGLDMQEVNKMQLTANQEMPNLHEVGQ